MRTNIRYGKLATAVGIALAAIATPLQGATTWKANIWGPARFSTQPLEAYAKEVAAKTGGQLKIDFTYNQSKPADGAELLKSGAAEGAYFCSSYFGEKMPLVTVLDLPMFAPESIPALGRVELALADHPVIQAELRKWNAKMLIPVPLPQYQLMGTRRIAKVDDFKGAKVRISPEMGKIFEEYGASTYLTSGPDTLAGLKSGALDVAALPYPSGFATFKVHDGAKYVTEKISLGTQLCYFAVGHKAWEALPAGTQKVMLGLRQPTVASYEGIYARDDAANIESFRRQGLEFVQFSAADRARLVAKAIKYWQAWIDEREKQGLKAREVFEFAQEQIREFTRK